MALNKAGLTEDLEALFSSPGGTVAECAVSWADAMGAYASSVQPPSLSVATAATTLSTALAAAFSGPSVIADVEVAFKAFAAAVGLGMAPAFTGVPPVGLVGFASEFAKSPDQWAATHPEAAELWADKIHAWMTTGSATLVAPPNTITPWS